MRIVVLLAVVLVCRANAVVGSCLTSFGSFSESAEPDEVLIANTFDQLLNELGGRRLSVSALDEIVASENPFNLPPRLKGLDALERHLSQFEELLEKNGWNVPPVRTRLLKQVSARRDAHARVGRETEAAIEQASSRYTIQLNAENGLRSTPDGSRVVGASGGWLTPSVWRYFDLSARKVWDIRAEGIFEGGSPPPTFLPGGKEAIILYSSEQVWRVPLLDGMPDWPNKVTVPAPNGLKLWGNIHVGKSAEYAYLDADAAKKILRLNLKTNTFHRLATGKLLGSNGEFADWGTVPGTDELYLLTHRKNGARVHLVRADRKGRLSETAPGPEWTATTSDATDELPCKITWSADGKQAYVSGFTNVGKVETFYPGQSRALPLRAAAGIVPEGSLVLHFAVGPPGGDGAFQVRTADVNGIHSRLILFEQTTGRVTGEMPVSDDTNGLLFTQDGNRLLVSERSGNATVINLERLRE